MLFRRQRLGLKSQEMSEKPENVQIYFSSMHKVWLREKCTAFNRLNPVLTKYLIADFQGYRLEPFTSDFSGN